MFEGTRITTITETLALEATLYGTIIGEVSVTPSIAAPGQPVQIEVLNTLGEPISDPAVSVTVQGVPGSSRWEQYSTAGTRTLGAVASNGRITETGTASVSVGGTAVEFTVDPPLMKQLPIIEATIVPGLPYAGSFTLGTPRSVSGALVTARPAQMTAETAATGNPAVATAAEASPATDASTPATPASSAPAGVITGGAASGSWSIRPIRGISATAAHRLRPRVLPSPTTSSRRSAATR